MDESFTVSFHFSVGDVESIKDAYVIAVEDQAKQRLERLSALHKIKPVDMTKLSADNGQTDNAVITPNSRPHTANNNNHISHPVYQVFSPQINGHAPTAPYSSSSSENLTQEEPLLENRQPPQQNVSNNNNVSHQSARDHPQGVTEKQDGNNSSAASQASAEKDISSSRAGLQSVTDKNIRNNRSVAEESAPQPSADTPTDMPSRVNGYLDNNPQKNRPQSEISLLHQSEQGGYPNNKATNPTYGMNVGEDGNHGYDDIQPYEEGSVEFNGPHREMAVDVPHDFVATYKEPPRYPRPLSMNMNTNSLPKQPPSTPSRGYDVHADKYSTDANLAVAAHVASQPQMSKAEQAERIRKYQVQDYLSLLL